MTSYSPVWHTHTHSLFKKGGVVVIINPRQEINVCLENGQGEGQGMVCEWVCVYAEAVESRRVTYTCTCGTFTAPLPTVRASKSRSMVPWSFTMPDSWMHFTNSSCCMYFFGSWKRFTVPSSCPLPWRARSRSWSLLTRLIRCLSSGLLSAWGDILWIVIAVLVTLTRRTPELMVKIDAIGQSDSRWQHYEADSGAQHNGLIELGLTCRRSASGRESTSHLTICRGKMSASVL